MTYTDEVNVDAAIYLKTGKAFGAYLITNGKINETAHGRATKFVTESNERLGCVLTRLGLLSERDLAEECARFFDLPIIDQSRFPDAPILEDRLVAIFYI